MIATTLGRRFLEVYNTRHGTSHTPKAFFEEVFVPLFFDHPKYMHAGGNAPFNNPKIKRGTTPDKEERAVRIAKTIAKIEEDPEGSSPIGYPSAAITATTSGQVSSLHLKITPEDVYLAWIGGGLGVGIAGGLSLYFMKEDILMHLYEGWKHYRAMLNERPDLRGNQIDTWNGQWLMHVYNKKNFFKERPLANFDPVTQAKDGRLEIPTRSWVHLMFALASHFPNERLFAYVFNLGQSNETIGFIPLDLPKARNLNQLYKKLFGEQQYLLDQDKIEQVYAKKNSFRLACERGVIGLWALEPRDLRKMMEAPKKIKTEGDELHEVSLRTYKTWIIAMLDNSELYALAQKMVKHFLHYETQAERGKTTFSRNVENLLKASNADAFLNGLLPIVKTASEDTLADFRALIEQVNMLSDTNFRRFLILLKLDYQIAQSESA